MNVEITDECVTVVEITNDSTEITVKLSEAIPTHHTHPISDIVGLQTELDDIRVKMIAFAVAL